MSVSGDRATADAERSRTYRALGDALDRLGVAASEEENDAVALRTIAYPFGSGQGDEIAFRSGLKPMFRELLSVSEIERARARFEAAGFATEVAERIYGDTKDGWDDTAAGLGEHHPSARRALFVGRDLGALKTAAALDQEKTDEADLALGRLLGYPRCCVEAFLDGGKHRKAPALHRAAWERTHALQTTALALPRLNTLDLAVFHFVPWYPCQLRCEPSARYADGVANVIAARAPAFVAAIDAALGMHRLMLTDDLQISIEGTRIGDVIEVSRVVPTAQHRHPRAALDPVESELLARLTAWLKGAKLIELRDGSLRAEGKSLPLSSAPLLVSFG